MLAWNMKVLLPLFKILMIYVSPLSEIPHGSSGFFKSYVTYDLYCVILHRTVFYSWEVYRIITQYVPSSPYEGSESDIKLL